MCCHVPELEGVCVVPLRNSRERMLFVRCICMDRERTISHLLYMCKRSRARGIHSGPHTGFTACNGDIMGCK